MLFTCQSSDLKAVVGAVTKVVKSKNAMPILDCVLISPNEDGNLTFVGSDGDITIYADLAVEDADGLFEIAVPASDLENVAKELGDFPVSFDIDPKSFDVKISDFLGDFGFMGVDAKEYPRQELPSGGPRFVAKADVVLSSTSTAAKYTGDDALRPVTKAVVYDMRTNGLHIVASDSKKLFADVVPSLTVDTPVMVLVQGRVADIAGKCIELSPDVDVEFLSGEKNVCFRANGITVVGRTIEGRFPKWESVVPKSNNAIAVLDRALLRSAIARVRVGASSTGLMRLEFDGAGKVQVSARDIDFNKMSRVSIQTISQEGIDSGFEICLNTRHLNDALDAFSSKTVTLLMSDPARAMLVKETVDGLRTVLIAPMQKGAY